MVADDPHGDAAVLLLEHLAEVLQQQRAPTFRLVATVVDHARQLLHVVLLHALVVPLAQNRLLRQLVLPAEVQNAVRRLPVSPRAPRLLVVVRQRLRDLEVDHEPDVRLVDPHAEGDRRHDDPQTVVRPAVCHPRAKPTRTGCERALRPPDPRGKTPRGSRTRHPSAARAAPYTPSRIGSASRSR